MAIQAQMYNSGFAFGDYSMDNACNWLNSNTNLCSISQQQKQNQEQQLMQKVPPFLPKDDHQQFSSPAFSQTVSGHIESQRNEIDLLINSQNEKLRMALQEQRRHQVSLFMKKYESKIQFLIKQKEGEIESAARRTAELQEVLMRMEIENQTWQRAARESEAMVASLTGRIERVMRERAAEDAESCCCLGEDENPEPKTMMVCKWCKAGRSCVIMLPCRHMCSCRDCDALLDCCPVCKMVKKASIEALI